MEPERLDYALTETALVWDVGAYRGDFAAAILERFHCRVMAFECLPVYLDAIRKRLPDIELHPFGLADRNYHADIHLAGDRTSAHAAAANDPGYIPGPLMPAVFRDAVTFMDDNHIANVDLAKINIEGDEYPLLRRLLDSGHISRFNHLQVQFHTFVPEFGELYLAIKKDLERTHTLSWRRPFVWESWARR